MAAARPHSHPHPYEAPHSEEWQDLRSELVALLDQVQTRVVQAGRAGNGYSGLSERMRQLRQQVAQTEPESRHRDALRSVQRAIDRFSDRSEPTGPENPRAMLDSAIQQIRSRRLEARSGDPQPRPVEGSRFEDLARAVDGVSGRLEDLERELKGPARAETGSVREIAEQVGQLSEIVELLAGAVGETSQTKRLEEQIAALAALVTEGPQAALSTINKRLDDVSLTVGKLAELQKRYGDRADTAGVAARLDDVATTMGRLADLQVQLANRMESPEARDSLAAGMHAIEEGVRNVYDRIEVIERSVALAPTELERVTEELARFTAAMHTPQQSQVLIELIDALNSRVADIETGSAEVHGLKSEIDGLRQTVVEAVESRFDNLESQIEALADQVSARPLELTIGQLEAQVRQLVARMDQTGEQLSGLTRLYNQSAERSEATTPDPDGLANLVAQRTAEAMTSAAAAPATTLDEHSLDELESRLARIVKAAVGNRDFDHASGLIETISGVSERVAHLESSLRDPQPTGPAGSRVPASPAWLDPEAEEISPRSPGASESKAGTSRTTPQNPRTPPNDLMPKNPGDEAPLVDTDFGDSSPISAALEARNGWPRRPDRLRSASGPIEPNELPPPPVPFVGLEQEPEVSSAEPQRRTTDPAESEFPPLTFGDEQAARPRVPGRAEMPLASYPTDPGVPPSRNTFIEAHRRAARQSIANKLEAQAGGSLIGRALARFQGGRSDGASDFDGPQAAEQQSGTRPGLSADSTGGPPERATQGHPAARGRPISEHPPVEAEGESFPAGDRSVPDEPQESFLLRHRKPLLLGASLIVIACLAVNLVSERLAERSTPVAQPALLQSGDASLAPTPIAEQRIETIAATAAARTIPVARAMTAANIDPGAATGFVPATSLPAMVRAFTLAPARAATRDTGTVTEFGATPPLGTGLVPLQTGLDETATVEAPEGIGPDQLAHAAVDGDPRAQFEVATRYAEGRAVAENLPEAVTWYTRAAVQGFAPAQYRLASLFENGKGLDRDLEQARLWYQRAAEAGNRMAMHNLAAIHASSESGEQQFETAAAWFERAANLGMKDSQFNLGMLYARGLGVPQDLATSYKWFALAARNGDTDAAKSRDEIAASLDPATMQSLRQDLEDWEPADIDLAANFAPIGAWSESFDPGATIARTEIVVGVQRALDQLGFDIGVPDGLAGARTAEAIRTFERSIGMNEVGAINPRLLAVLGSQPV